MALELETIVMREIGLGNHYSWFNGSGSCRWIRQEAAKKLPDLILKHSQKGEMAEPDKRLCAMLTKIADIGDSEDYSLTNTWQAASYIIAEHIHQAKATPKERNAAYERILEYLQKIYLAGKERETFFDSRPGNFYA